jgi:hypothetical protein
MYTNELTEEVLRENFEHWLDQAVRSGNRGAHLQPVTALSLRTWQAIDAVADAASQVSGASTYARRVQDAVSAARLVFDHEVAGSPHDTHHAIAS